MVNVDVEKTANFDHQAQQIKRLLKVEGLQTYVTSDTLLADEFSNTTEEGIKKTAVITIIFIFYCISAGFSFVNHSPSFVTKCGNYDDYFPKFSDEPC